MNSLSSFFGSFFLSQNFSFSDSPIYHSVGFEENSVSHSINQQNSSDIIIQNELKSLNSLSNKQYGPFDLCFRFPSIMLCAISTPEEKRTKVKTHYGTMFFESIAGWSQILILNYHWCRIHTYSFITLYGDSIVSGIVLHCIFYVLLIFPIHICRLKHLTLCCVLHWMRFLHEFSLTKKEKYTATNTHSSIIEMWIHRTENDLTGKTINNP